MLRRLAFASTVASVLALTTALPAWAVPATDEGATRITDSLRRYLGALPGIIETVPEGDIYRLTVDLAPLAERAVDAYMTLMEEGDKDAASDAESAESDWTRPVGTQLRPALAISPAVFTLTDRGDGTWDVVQDDRFTVQATLGGITLFDRSSQLHFKGVFDTALGTFSQLETSETGIRQIENQYLSFGLERGDPVGPDGKPLPFSESVTTTADTRATGTAVANRDGGVDLRSTGSARTMLMQHNIYYSEPDENGRRDTFSIEASVGALTSEGELRGLRVKPMLDLLAWGVALPSLDELPARQDELKPLIRAALPLFNDMRVTVPIEDLRVDTAVLRGGFKRMDFAFDMTGLVRDGRVRLGLNLSGPDLPVMMLDPWMRPLVPDAAGIDVTMTGFDFETPTDMALTALDLSADDPLATLDADAAGRAVLRDGRIRFDIAPSLIQGKDYAIAFSGWAEGGPEDALPQGKLTIEATGLDAVERQIEAGFGRRAEQALEILREARAEATQQEGKDVWVLDFAELEDRFGIGAEDQVGMPDEQDAEAYGMDDATDGGASQDGPQPDPQDGATGSAEDSLADEAAPPSSLPSPPPPMPLPAPSPAPARP